MMCALNICRRPRYIPSVYSFSSLSITYRLASTITPAVANSALFMNTKLPSYDNNKNHYVVNTVRFQSSYNTNKNNTSSSLSLKMTDYWISLRWKAANALTASLSPNEREELLKRLYPNFFEAKQTTNATTVNDETTNGNNGLNGNNSPMNGISIVVNGKTKIIQDEMDVSNSIAEAVAAARAEEAQRISSKWEKEKDLLQKQAEQAVRQRIQAEIEIQKWQTELLQREKFNQWQYDVQREKEEIQQQQNQQSTINQPTTSTTPSDPIDSITVNGDTEQSQKNQQENGVVPVAEEEQQQQKLVDVHPILGPVILDLGYKRIYVVSAKILASIPVWKKQRIYRHERAKSMANDKLKTLTLGLPGVIGLHEDINGKLSILDGQHRVGMMTILQEKLNAVVSSDDDTEEKGKENTKLDLDRVLVELYPQQPNHIHLSEDEHATELFLEVNKAEPVKLVDMPGVAKSIDRKIITDAANILYEQYRDMFSSSTKCRMPHVNIDNMRDAIFASNVLTRHNIKSSKQLMKWILEQNDLLQIKYSTGVDATVNCQKNNISNAALKKANTYQFYLGLESSWLYG